MATTTENIRKSTNNVLQNRQNYSGARHYAYRPTEVSSKSMEGLKIAASSLPPKKEQSTSLTVDEAITKKNIKEMSVDEFESYSKNSVLTAEEASEIEKKKEELNLKSDKSGKTPEAGKLKKDKNPDEDFEDDDKFDIQQGDFIDFLMKEVVLASAAWVGKKVSGRINLALYEAASGVYHKVGDVVETGWDGVKELYDDAITNMGNIKKNLGFHKVPYSYIKDAPETYQNIYNAHNNAIDSSKQTIDDSEAISRLCMEAVGQDELKIKEHNGKSFWYDKESGRTIPLDDKYVRTILTKAQQIHKNAEKLDLTPEQKNKVYKTTATNMAAVLTDAFAVSVQAKIFANNMATAQMVKDSANKETTGKNREEYLAHYEKDFYIVMKKLRNNENVGDIKSLDDLVNLSDRARKKACDNQKDNTPGAENDFLTNINSLNLPQEKQQNIETIYSAALGSEHLSNLNNIHTELEQEIAYLEQGQRDNDNRRSQAQKTRERIENQNSANPNSQSSNQQQPKKPVIEQGREN